MGIESRRNKRTTDAGTIAAHESRTHDCDRSSGLASQSAMTVIDTSTTGLRSVGIRGDFQLRTGGRSYWSVDVQDKHKSKLPPQ